MDLVSVGSLCLDFSWLLGCPQGQGWCLFLPSCYTVDNVNDELKAEQGLSKCCLLTPWGRWGTMTSQVSAETQRVSADSKPSASKNQVFRAQRWDQIFTSTTPVFVALGTTDIVEIIYISNCFYFLESLSNEPLFFVTHIPLYPVSSCGRGLFVGIFLNYTEHPPPRPTHTWADVSQASTMMGAGATGPSALFFFLIQFI